MEPYLLTEEDIKRLGITDAMAGEPATAQEITELNKINPSSVLPVLPTKNNITPVVAGSENIAIDALNATNTSAEVIIPPSQNINGVIEPQKKPINQAQLDLLNMVKMANQQAAPAAPEDPYDSLSKTQKRMLAFAGIRDAGLALQGKEGSSVANLMSQFTERADIERKRKAAASQRQMLGTFLSGSAEGTLDPQAIINAMALGALPPEAGNAMLAQMERDRLRKLADEAVVGSGAGALEDLNRLTDMISTGGMVTGFTGWLFNKIPFSEARAARNVADTLRSGMALGALRELKAGGATLGSVSEKELDLLESAIARIDLNLDRDQVMAQMATIEKHYKDAVRRAYNKASENEKRGFDAYFAGTTPAWVLDPSAPDPTKAVDPTIEDLSEEEKRRLGL